MEIKCEKCGKHVLFVSDEDFITLFEKNNQKYHCWDCKDWREPCKDCLFFIAYSWDRDVCTLHDYFNLVCTEKEVERPSKEDCDVCDGNNYPTGEYCQGCVQINYRRSRG